MKYTPKKIYNLYCKWQDFMSTSWQRGDENVDFIEKSHQEPQDDSKENLIFNFASTVLETAKANAKDIDLSLSLSSPLSNDMQEQNTFKLLLKKIMLNNDSLRAIPQSLDQAYSFGQSALLVKNVRENEETLNQTLEIKHLPHIKKGFFDCYSPTPDFNSGQFCGYITTVSRKKLEKTYPKLRNSDVSKTCDVIDFWFKDQKQVNYIPLANGEYKREDLINEYKDACN